MRKISINLVAQINQKGVTMIEALVALFVFSVGALGLAAMQTASLVQGDDSRQRSLAIWKAQELAERIRSTKTVTNPAGLGALYVAAIANDDSDIGTDTAANVYDCPNAAPTRCADYRNATGNVVAGANCTNAELVAFDIWEVLCEGNTGLNTSDASATGGDGAGSRGLQSMEIALITNNVSVPDPIAGGGVNITTAQFSLYIEWVARSADANTDLTGNVTTNLCGTDRNIVAQLDAYCLRFQ